MPPSHSNPVYASFPSSHLTIGTGVAIFHIASARVVVCYHTGERYWFLPKGRRNANEDTIRAAEREGFEESGYRNRVIPIPLRHRQPDPDEGPHEVFVTEPVWTQFLPLTATTQYLLFWYVAESVPREIENAFEEAGDRVYRQPARYPESGLTIKQRVALDIFVGENGEEEACDPVWHQGTGVNEEEMMYKSYLLPIDEARCKLRGSVMEDVVKRGWEGIQLRMKMEER